DNLLERLAAMGQGFVRLGHPVRVLEHLRSSCLDELVQEHEDVKLARKMQNEASKLLHAASRFHRSPPPKGERDAKRREAKALFADARALEQRAVDRILDGAQIVAATATGLDDH